MKLSIDTRALSQRDILLTLTGEIDYATAQNLRSTITTALTSDIDSISIDLSGVTFVDSTGIGTLVVARRICNDMRVALRVVDASPFIRRLLAVVGVAETLGLPADAIAPPMPQPRIKPAAQPA